MTRHVLAACGAIAIASATVTAQSPQPSTAQPPATQPAAAARASDAEKMVTVTGCLAKAGSSASAPSSASAAGSSGGFVLTNAQYGSKTMSSPSSAAPANPPAASSGAGRAAASSYALKTQGATVDLSQHLNHTVTVTGTIDMAGPSAGTSPPSATDSTRPAATMPTLNVTTVTMVSSSCS